MTTPLTVDVWSDIACPWCYIGKRRFEAGLASLGDQAPPVALTYHSFELAPDTPVDFEGSEVEFLAEYKHVPVEQVHEALDHLTGLAREVGLDYDFDALRHTKTLAAHQLLHLAKARGLQLELAERLFKAYFTEGGHVGHVEDLVGYAQEVGLDPDEARAALADGRYAADVQADLDQAVAYGIQGVPFYVIDGRYGISGAQPPETFAQVLAQVAAERAA